MKPVIKNLLKHAVSAAVFISLVMFSFRPEVFANGGVKIQNPGFEKGMGSWKAMTAVTDKNTPEISCDPSQSHSGGKSIHIRLRSPNAVRCYQTVRVSMNTTYIFTCWIKARNIGKKNAGAYMSITDQSGKPLTSSISVSGTSGSWEHVLIGINNVDSESLGITLGFGDMNSLNTGEAWYDDVDMSPLYIGEKPVITYFIFFTVLSLLLLAYFYMKKRPVMVGPMHERTYMILILAAGLMLRFMAAPAFEGFVGDVNCFKSWSSAAAENLLSVYGSSSIPIDYPPLYIYVLFLIGKMASILNVYSSSGAYLLLVKLPSILADAAASYIIYRLGRSKLQPVWGLILAALYLFNPAVLLNSTVWGQVDSFFTLIIVAALALALNGKIIPSSVFFTLAVLMKPQGVIFLPVLLLEFIRLKKIKTAAMAAAAMAVTAIAVVLPFALKHSDPLWIMKLYMGTGSEYPYASMNAFNLFALFGGNKMNDSSTFLIFSYKIWGYAFIVIITAFAAYLYYKCRSASASVLAALILISGVFTLANRMHERYIYPALAMAIMAFVVFKSGKLLVCTVLLGILSFLNSYVVYYYNWIDIEINALNPLLFFISLFCVITFIYVVWTALEACGAISLENGSAVRGKKGVHI